MKAALFDLDDTLYAYGPAHAAALMTSAEELAEALGTAPGEVMSAYEVQRARAFAELGPVASAHSRALYFKWITEELTGSTAAGPALAAAKAYWRRTLEVIEPVPGCVELLEELRGAGLGLAILTDLTVDIQLEKLERLGLSGYFPHVITSEEAGRDKPDPAGFRLALARLGVEAGECVMIGDNPVNDIEGAHGVGMHAVWIGDDPDRELPPGTRRIRALAELRGADWLVAP